LLLLLLLLGLRLLLLLLLLLRVAMQGRCGRRLLLLLLPSAPGDRGTAPRRSGGAGRPRGGGGARRRAGPVHPTAPRLRLAPPPRCRAANGQQKLLLCHVAGRAKVGRLRSGLVRRGVTQTSGVAAKFGHATSVCLPQGGGCLRPASAPSPQRPPKPPPPAHPQHVAREQRARHQRDTGPAPPRDRHRPAPHTAAAVAETRPPQWGRLARL
jgi:hypothetical protein